MDVTPRYQHAAIGLMDVGGDLGQGLGERYADGYRDPHLALDRVANVFGNLAETLAPQAANTV